MHNHAAVSVTKEALIVRIPWSEVAGMLKPRRKAREITAQDVLAFIKEGRTAHRKGKTRVIRSLSEIR